MAENEDIYFQSVEARNTLYNEMPDIVNNYMKEINKLMNTDYQPFNYYGAKDAENVIIIEKTWFQKLLEIGLKNKIKKLLKKV